MGKKYRGTSRRTSLEISDCQYGTIRENNFASLLYEGYSCENQAAEPDYSTAKILGIDYAMQGWQCFQKRSKWKKQAFFLPVKKCCKCGRIKKELRLSERVYHCECGNEMDRDRNAAINIREEAKRMLTA